jgi:hypothetical protein
MGHHHTACRNKHHHRLLCRVMALLVAWRSGFHLVLLAVLLAALQMLLPLLPLRNKLFQLHLPVRAPWMISKPHYYESNSL